MVDALDRAISSAMGDELPPAPAPETDSEGTEAEVHVEEHGDEEQLSRKDRDEKGRFLPSKVKAETPKEEKQPQPEASPEAQPAAETQPVDYAAGRLTPEEKAILDQLPPEASTLVKQILAKQDAHHTRRMMEVSAAKKEFAALDEVMAPNRTRWRAHGISDADAVRNLLAVETMMMRDAPGTIRWLADQYRVPMPQAAPAVAGEGAESVSVTAAPAPAPAVDPVIQQRIDFLEQQLQGLTNTNQQGQAAQMQAVVQKVMSEHPLKDFMPLIEDQIPTFIQILRPQNPGDTPEQLLNKAIDKALRANDQTYALLVDQKMKEALDRSTAQSQQRVEKARRAASSVRGTPVSGMERMSRDLDSIISEALDGQGL